MKKVDEKFGFSKNMYYLCKRNQKDNDLMATLLNVSSFETFFDILEQNYIN